MSSSSEDETNPPAKETRTARKSTNSSASPSIMPAPTYTTRRVMENESVYRSCIVPLCESTSISTPNKMFLSAPDDAKIRKQWLKQCGRDPWSVATNTSVYFCEDHFNKKDHNREKTVYNRIAKMRPSCFPSKFDCQEIRDKRQAAKNASKAIASHSSFEKSMESFNPDNSNRERRKITKKLQSTSRRPIGALYDERGVHITTGMDVCDCLKERCPGCWFECPRCGSQKCGTECRVYRKYMVETIEYNGYDRIAKNTLLSKNY